jgi:hypothetical protein
MNLRELLLLDLKSNNNLGPYWGSNPDFKIRSHACYPLHYKGLEMSLSLSGIEPEAIAWKTTMLPLHYNNVYPHRGSNPDRKFRKLTCYPLHYGDKASTGSRTQITSFVNLCVIHYTIKAMFLPGIEPGISAVLEQRLNHWTTRHYQESNLEE